MQNQFATPRYSRPICASQQFAFTKKNLMPYRYGSLPVLFFYCFFPLPCSRSRCAVGICVSQHFPHTKKSG
ncbi:MAG: hypothetical protein EAY75_05790 [Bacteroidetes bacterium]|nr:MAG: hypothetical protein EAY75_05790 [Bacteroidota bacterium]